MSNASDNIVIVERLTRVEEKIDSLLDKASHSHDRLDEHETRIRSLEHSGAKLFGMGTILAAVTGLFGSRVMDHLL